MPFAATEIAANGIRDCHSKWSEWKRERQISYDIAYMWVIVAQSCLTLWDRMDCNLSGSCSWDSPGKNTGVGCHFLLQRSSWPRDRTQVSYIAGRFFTIWATREAFAYMWNLKKWYRYRKQTYSYHRVKGGRMRQIYWEIWNDVYILLYIKQITNKDLLYSIRNSTHL